MHGLISKSAEIKEMLKQQNSTAGLSAVAGILKRRVPHIYNFPLDCHGFYSMDAVNALVRAGIAINEEEAVTAPGVSLSEMGTEKSASADEAATTSSADNDDNSCNTAAATATATTTMVVVSSFSLFAIVCLFELNEPPLDHLLQDGHSTTY